MAAAFTRVGETHEHNLGELEEDCSNEEWEAREELEQKLSELRQKYTDSLGQELLA
jgi:hypothetical protein